MSVSFIWNTWKCCIYPLLWWNRKAHKAKQCAMNSTSSYPHLNLLMFAVLTVNCVHADMWTFYQDTAGRLPDEGPNEASPCLSDKGQWTHTHTLISPLVKCQGPVWVQRNALSPFIHWNIKHNNNPSHYPLWQTGQEWKVVLRAFCDLFSVTETSASWFMMCLCRYECIMSKITINKLTFLHTVKHLVTFCKLL